VNLVDDDDGVALERRISTRLAQQHPVRQVAHLRRRARFVVEANAVADEPSQACTHLGGDAARDGDGRDAAGLGDGDRAVRRVPCSVQELRDLRRFPRSRLRRDDDRRRARNHLEQLGARLPHGEPAALSE